MTDVVRVWATAALARGGEAVCPDTVLPESWAPVVMDVAAEFGWDDVVIRFDDVQERWIASRSGLSIGLER